METLWFIARLLLGTVFIVLFTVAFTTHRLARVGVALVMLLSILGKWPWPAIPSLTHANVLLQHAFWLLVTSACALLYRLLQSRARGIYSTYVAVIGWVIISLLIMVRLPVAMLILVLFSDPDRILSDMGIGEGFKVSAEMVLFWAIILSGYGPDELGRIVTTMIGLLIFSMAAIPMLLRSSMWQTLIE